MLFIIIPGLTVVYELFQIRLSLPFLGLGLPVVQENVGFEGRILLSCNCFCPEVTGKIFHFHLLNTESRYHSGRPRAFL